MKIFRLVRVAASVTFVAGCAIAGSACSSDSDTGSAATVATTATTAAPATAAAPQAPITTPGTAGVFFGVDGTACVAEQEAINLAIQSFEVLNGDGDVTEAQLVAAGLLREESPTLDIAAGNVVVAAPGGACAG